jgi:hypothetical protein
VAAGHRAIGTSQLARRKSWSVPFSDVTTKPNAAQIPKMAPQKMATPRAVIVMARL